MALCNLHLGNRCRNQLLRAELMFDLDVFRISRETRHTHGLPVLIAQKIASTHHLSCGLQERSGRSLSKLVHRVLETTRRSGALEI